ncbi:unnamed protein product, partial [Rotaria sp. Silwood1]
MFDDLKVCLFFFKVLTNRNEYELMVEKANAHVDEILSTIKNLDDEKMENNVQSDHQESLSKESNKNFNENHEEKIESIDNSLQEIHQTSIETLKSPISTTPTEQTSPISHTPSADLKNHEILSEIPKASQWSTLSENQQIFSDPIQSPTTAAGVQVYLITASTDNKAPLTSTVPILTQMYRPPISNREDRQKSSHTSNLSSASVSTDIETLSELEASPNASVVFEDSSEIHPLSSTQLKDEEQRSEDYSSLTAILKEVQALSKISHVDTQLFSGSQKSSTSPTNSTSPNDPSVSFDTHPSSFISSENQQISNISSNEQPILTESISPLSQENLSISLDSQQQASTLSQEQQISSEIEQTNVIDENIQEEILSIPADEHESIASVAHNTTESSITEEIDEKQELTKSSYDNDQHDENTKSSINENDHITTTDIDYNDHCQSIKSLPNDEHNINQTDRQESLSFDTPPISQDEIKENVNPFEDNKLILKQDETKT